MAQHQNSAHTNQSSSSSSSSSSLSTPPNLHCPSQQQVITGNSGNYHLRNQIQQSTLPLSQPYLATPTPSQMLTNIQGGDQYVPLPMSAAAAGGGGGYTVVPNTNGNLSGMSPVGYPLVSGTNQNGGQQQVYKYSSQQQTYQPQPGGGFSITTEQQSLMVVNGGGNGIQGNSNVLQPQPIYNSRPSPTQYSSPSSSSYSSNPSQALQSSQNNPHTTTHAYVDCTVVAAAAAAAAAATITAAAIQQQQQQGFPAALGVNAVTNALYPSVVPRPLTGPPTYCQAKVDGQYYAVNLGEINYMVLNSFKEMVTLIPPRTISQSILPGSAFKINRIGHYLADNTVRIFIRFCKYDPTSQEQADCMPKGFNFVINQKAFQVKNRVTCCPYDITQRVICETSDVIQVRMSLDPSTNESPDDYIFGIFLMKKIDHQLLLKNFRARWPQPFEAKYTIELAKKKLNPVESDDDELAIIEKDNQIKVSLLCPLTSTRIKTPVRSIKCDHVHCFDVESFVKLNDISPKWKCPICNVYIKFDNLILDGFFTELLQKAPPTCDEVVILPDGSYEFVLDELPPGAENDNQNSNAVDPKLLPPSTSSTPSSSRISSSENVKRSCLLNSSSKSGDFTTSEDSASSSATEEEEKGGDYQDQNSSSAKQPLKKRKVIKKKRPTKRRYQSAERPPKFIAKSSLSTVANIECINLDSDSDNEQEGPGQRVENPEDSGNLA